MNPEQLCGSWRLLQAVVRSADGQTMYPFGKSARGYIFYTQDGFVSVAIESENRKPFSVSDILAGSEEERATAAATYVSYAGTYSLEGVKVRHHIAVSLFPNWVGEVQERWVRLEGDELTLSTEPMLLAGKQGVAELKWQRLTAATNQHIAH